MPELSNTVQKCFQLLWGQDAKRTELPFWSSLLVTARCMSGLTLPLLSDPGGCGAGATVLWVRQGLSWPRERLDPSPLPLCRGGRCSACASAPAHAAAPCRSPRLTIRAHAALAKLRFLLQVKGLCAKLLLPHFPRGYVYQGQMYCTFPWAWLCVPEGQQQAQDHP